MWTPTNVSLDFSFGVLCHDALILPSPIAVPNVSLELPATMFWPPGYALNKLSMTSTVEHKSMDIVLDGHDHGPMCLHVTIPVAANPLLAVIIPLSSRKINFTGATVEMDKKAVGLSAFWMITPMQTCGDPVSAPTAFSMINLLVDSVHIGVTWMDMLWGLVNIIRNTGIDYLFSKILQGPKSSPGQILRDRIKNRISTFGQIAGRELFKKFKSDLLPKTLNSLAKNGLNALAGLATSSCKGDPTFKLGVGNDWLGAGVEISSKKGLGGEVHGGGLQAGAGSVDSAAWGTSSPPLL